MCRPSDRTALLARPFSQRCLARVAEVEDSNYSASHLISDVIFEAGKIAAAYGGGNFRAGLGESQNLTFPQFVFIEKRRTEMRLGLEMTCCSDEFLLCRVG